MSANATSRRTSLTSLTTCPRCNQKNVRRVWGQRAVCLRCSDSQRRVFQFCRACQREWPTPGGESCSLPSCAMRAALLSPDLIGGDNEEVKNCPLFRVCPKCRMLLTHTGEGCPNIECPQCQTVFCYRCLKQNYHEDEDEDEDGFYDDGEEEEEEEEDYFDYNHCHCAIVDNVELIKAQDQERTEK